MRFLLYIDPGTGSMLFTLAVGLVSVVWFGARALFMKMKFFSPAAKKDRNKKNIVIYGEDKRYWTTFKGILDEFERRRVKVTYLAGSADDPLLEKPYKYVETEVIGLGNKAYAKLNFLNARIVLATTPGLDVYQWKRSRNVDWYVHIPHMPGELTTYRMFATDFYDALLLSGQYQVDDCRSLEHLRNLPEKECAIVGVPYLDLMANRLRGMKTGTRENITVLVAPSWGDNSLLNRFGGRLFDALAATGYHIVVRPHPQSFISEKELIDKLMRDYPQLEWNRDADNFDVLNRSDIMISDFSGVIFDFALVFDKPVICAYTDFDKSKFDAWWLDTPIWTATAIPRIGTVLSEENLPDIKALVDSALEDKSNERRRQEVRDETWMHRGEGAARVVDYLVQKLRKLQ
jgi:hypothetical protein